MKYRRWIIWAHLVVPVCLFLFFSFVSFSGAQQSSPRAVIQKFDEALLESMKKADQLGFQGRYKILEPVMKDTFAFRFMASKVAGRYWATMNKDQQDTFLTTYTEWSIATYAARFNGYSGERFDPPVESGPATGAARWPTRAAGPARAS